MMGPHESQQIEQAGTPLDDAEAAVILVHGRGATARGILGLREEFARDGVVYLAPQAHRGTWYPQSFLAPLDANEPHLSSALRALGGVVSDVSDAGIPPEKTLVAGFSQGACLSCEFVARNPGRYGGLAALSGGLIGPEGTPREYEGSLDGTPVFLGCSDVDPHIPVERVHETRDVFQSMGADVTEQIYEGMGHTVNEDELDHVDRLVANL